MGEIMHCVYTIMLEDFFLILIFFIMMQNMTRLKKNVIFIRRHRMKMCIWFYIIYRKSKILTFGLVYKNCDTFWRHVVEHLFHLLLPISERRKQKFFFFFLSFPAILVNIILIFLIFSKKKNRAYCLKKNY